MPYLNSSTSQKGFTLIELMVVVTIIGLLASAILASVGSARAQARDARRLSDMRNIRTAMELFYSAKGHYPSEAEGVSNSGEMLGDDNGALEQALAPYVNKMPRDPRHDGDVFYYSYDPQHCTDSVQGACDCNGGTAAVLAFHTAESDSTEVTKLTCSGGDMNIDDSDYNVVLRPAP